MADFITVVGAHRLNDLGRRLKAAGDKELKAELAKGINKAVKPLRQDVKASAMATLPKRGGYAGLVARSAIRTKRRMSGQMAGVRIVATNKIDIKRLDRQGRLRHPLFGNREFWYQQSVTPDWFGRPLREGAPKVRMEILRVIDELSRKLERR